MIVKQVNQLLRLLELFAEQKRPMTLTQISEALDIPKSSTHNMIETLTVRGYLYEVKARGGVYPSRKLLAVSELISTGDPVSSIIQDFLKKLAYETGETAILAVRDKSNVIYLDVIESHQPIRYSANVGDRRPIYATSGGKAILSNYPEDVLERELDAIVFDDLRDNTINDRKSLAQNILQGKQNGYFLNLSEYTTGVTGVGIPIVVEGRILGLSIAGPNHRMHDNHEQIAEHLKKSAHEIANALESVGIGPNSHLKTVANN